MARNEWAWQEVGEEHRLIGGYSPIRDCEAHFHETHILAFVRRGRATTHINSRRIDLFAGSALLVNPFEIIECVSSPDFEYDVCYPHKRFMQEVVIRPTDRGEAPRFHVQFLDGSLAQQLGELLSVFRKSGSRMLPSSSSIDTDMLDFLTRHTELFAARELDDTRPDYVVQACELIEELVEEQISVAEISLLVNRSRSHFARAFRDAVGLPPSSYSRQLRLARALERVRDGEPLADIAAHYGFYDQAHFTREFKRVYGTTPGLLARDITRCRHCA